MSCINISSDDEDDKGRKSSRKKKGNKIIKEMWIDSMVEIRQLKAEIKQEKAEKKALIQKNNDLTKELQKKDMELTQLKAGLIKKEKDVKVNESRGFLHDEKRLKTPPRRRHSVYPVRSPPPRSPMTPPLQDIYGPRNPSKTPSRRLYSPPKREKTLPPRSPVNKFRSSFKPFARRKSCYQDSYPPASKFNNNERFSRKQQQPWQQNSNGPKYIVESIEKGTENSVLYDYFKEFGDVDKVNIREKGIDQQNVEKCSAFLQFHSEPKDGFLDTAHVINANPLVVRKFIDGKDTEKVVDDWGSDELEKSTTAKRPRSRSLSPPRKYHRNESRGRSRSRSCYRAQSRYGSRSASSSSEEIPPKTRSISVSLMFQNWTESLLRSYFGKFGEIEVLKPPRTRNQRRIFIKYCDYSGAANALRNSEHYIEGEKYVIYPAGDY